MSHAKMHSHLPRQWEVRPQGTCLVLRRRDTCRRRLVRQAHLVLHNIEHY